MSQQNLFFFPAFDRTAIISLLKRAAKHLMKESKEDKILATFQNEIARSFGYLNWSLLHKHVFEMTESRFADFAARVQQNVDVQRFLRPQSRVVKVHQIKCTLFSKHLGYLAREFNDGDAQAIVLADSYKIKAVMESNDAYYYGAEKVKMHKGLLKNGFFEVPLVAPRRNGLHWIEGFHQVNAAIEEGMAVVPIGTSLALADQLEALVGLRDRDAIAHHHYDFSGCAAIVV